MKSLHSHRSAFTLIELILYIGLTAIVVVALTRVILTIISTRERVEHVSTVHHEARFVLDQVVSATLHARAVMTGASLFGSSSGRLVLSMSGALKSPLSFTLSGSRLFVQEGSGEALPITSTAIIVDEFHLSNLTPGNPRSAIQVRLHAIEASPLDGSPPESVQLQTAVSPRNP